MFFVVKHTIGKVIKKIYQAIFREEISPTVNIFLRNLSHAVFGYGIAAIFIFLFQILAGRILGPSEYGKYALVDSTAAFLYLFMTLGVSTAAIKYNAEKEDYERQQKIVSNSYIATLIIAFIFGSFFFLFSGFLARIFFIPLNVFRSAVIFAIGYVLYMLGIDNLCGLHQIEKAAFFRTCYGFLVLFFAALFLFKNYLSFITVVLVISFAYLAVFLLITVHIRPYLSFTIDKTWMKNLLEYGLYALGGSFLFIFLPTLSKLMVNKFLTLADVGVYNAYYFSSLNIVAFSNTIFITVFFPTVSKYPQKSSILKRIQRAVPFLFLIGTPVLFTVQWFVLKLFGQQYLVDYWLMLLFSLSGVIFFIFGLYIWLFYSKGIVQARLIVFLTALIFIINVLLNLYFIPRFLLRGAVFSLMVTYGTGWVYLWVNQKKLLR